MLGQIRVRAVTALIATVIVLAGCGDDSSPPASSASTAVKSPRATTTVDPTAPTEATMSDRVDAQTTWRLTALRQGTERQLCLDFEVQRAGESFGRQACEGLSQKLDLDAYETVGSETGPVAVFGVVPLAAARVRVAFESGPSINAPARPLDAFSFKVFVVVASPGARAIDARALDASGAELGRTAIVRASGSGGQ